MTQELQTYGGNSVSGARWCGQWQGAGGGAVWGTIIENRLSLPKWTERERKDCAATSAVKTAMPEPEGFTGSYMAAAAGGGGAFIVLHGSRCRNHAAVVGCWWVASRIYSHTN